MVCSVASAADEDYVRGPVPPTLVVFRLCNKFSRHEHRSLGHVCNSQN